MPSRSPVAELPHHGRVLGHFQVVSGHQNIGRQGKDTWEQGERTHTYLYIYIYIYIFVYIYIYICNMYIYIYIFIRVIVYIYMQHMHIWGCPVDFPFNHWESTMPSRDHGMFSGRWQPVELSHRWWFWPEQTRKCREIPQLPSTNSLRHRKWP